MGYFSNGTEGQCYEEDYCLKCVHYGDENSGCPVWFLHLSYNYEQFRKTVKGKTARDVLDTLIPREDIGNEQCRMFYKKGAV